MICLGEASSMSYLFVILISSQAHGNASEYSLSGQNYSFENKLSSLKTTAKIIHID